MHDRYISNSDRRSRHIIQVEAPAEAVWPFARRVDVGRSPFIRSLFTVRGMEDVRSFGDVDRLGFRILDEESPDFLAIGVVARPWQIKGGLQHLDGREKWLAFAEPGYAKISWSFGSRHSAVERPRSRLRPE